METNRTVPVQAEGGLPKPAPTSTQRWLLLAVLFVGIAFRVGLSSTKIAMWGGWLGSFWLVAMLAVTPFIWRRAIKSRTGLACGLAAIALCVLQIVHFYEDDGLREYLVLGIPAALAPFF